MAKRKSQPKEFRDVLLLRKKPVYLPKTAAEGETMPKADYLETSSSSRLAHNITDDPPTRNSMMRVPSPGNVKK